MKGIKVGCTIRFSTNGKVSPIDRAGGLGAPFPLVDRDLGPFCMETNSDSYIGLLSFWIYPVLSITAELGVSLRIGDLQNNRGSPRSFSGGVFVNPTPHLPA